jgi:GNAT superfamily N-acetyltransferase
MARVMVDTWFATHSAQVSPRALERRRKEWGYEESEQGWLRALATADGQTSLVLVGTDEGQIIAVAAAAPLTANSAEVSALYVDVPYQRLGVGRRLLERIIAHYRNCGRSTLHVATLAANRSAREFYEVLGGVVSGERDHDDGREVVYTWDLLGLRETSEDASA